MVSSVIRDFPNHYHHDIVVRYVFILSYENMAQIKRRLKKLLFECICIYYVKLVECVFVYSSAVCRLYL